MPSTYEPIATTTLGSNTGNVTFSSIPSTYTDLRLICSAAMVTNPRFLLFYFNTDNSTNYSNTYLIGDGTSAASARNTGQQACYATGSASLNTTVGNSTATIDIMNYSNTTTFKTALARSGNAGIATAAVVNLWRSTAAINQIVIWDYTGENFKTGSTFTLYGIKAA
jgi:hypothetical protein